IFVVQPATTTLTPSAKNLVTGAPLSVYWTTFAASPTDKIALFKVGAPNAPTDPDRTIVTGGATTGTFNVLAPDLPGLSAWRYLSGGVVATATSATLFIGDEGYSLTPSTFDPVAGGAMSVLWTLPGDPTGLDWIGWFKVGDPNTNPVPGHSIYTNGQVNG